MHNIIKTKLFLVTLFFLSIASAGEILVKADTIAIGGYSGITYETGTAIPSVIYGGVAGTACTGDTNSTCSSCTETSTLVACNLKSVYPTLKLTISFKLTKDIAQPSAIAKVFVLPDVASATSNQIGSAVTITTPTAASSIVNLSVTWNDICTPDCASGTEQVIPRQLAFGVDSNNNGDVEYDEVKRISVKFHIIPASATVDQAFCTSAAEGVCNVSLKPGDEKAILDSIPVTVASDSSTIPWDGIAFFPFPVAANNTSSPSVTDLAAFTGFKSGSISPIVKEMTADGFVSDSNITGLKNYQRYCLVYGTRNKAQNIFNFVTDGAAAPTACLTPSEVVGLLDDKHCFISTAAFGSDMAPQVQIFREFRNKYLLTNSLGAAFIKFYYQEGPQAAQLISQSEVLRSAARGLLYPVLGFAYLAVQYGLITALFILAVLLILLSQVSRFLFQNKKVSLILFILLMSPLLKAAPQVQTKKIQHPGAADGLIRITKDGTYIYDTGKPLKKESSHIRFGQAQHPTISIDIEQKNADGTTAGTRNFKFDDFYGDASKLILGYDYEWFPITDKGKLGLQGGISAMFASGHGRLVAAPSEPSVEKYSFFTIPITAGAVYRLEWKDKQVLAPYVAGGGTYVLLAEKREDKSDPNYAGGFGFYGAGGLLVNLGFLDPESSASLDNEYGISNMWLSLEYKTVQVNAAAFEFTNSYFNAGLSFDF